MSDYFEDAHGFDLLDAIKGAIDDEDVEHENEGVIAFYTTDGDVTVDFNDKTVSYEGDVVDFDDCRKSAIALAREELAKHEPVAELVVQEQVAKNVPETYAEAFTQIAAKSEKYEGYKKANPVFSIDGPVQLTYKQSSHGADRYYTYYTYNFLTRVLVVSASGSDSGAAVVPFARVDRESLEAMHAKLTDLGGTPPPLPAKESSNPLLFKPRAKGPDNG